MSAIVFLAVVVVGAVGALLRYGLSQALARYAWFPWAVLVVNVVGAAIGGVFLALLHHAGLADEWYTIAVTGFAGGLTTFSTWSVQTILLVMTGHWRTAAVSVGLNLVAGFAAVAAAYGIVTAAVG
ncbi:fluoride efflux transporter FluC [Lacisediminihabitans changchengi]|uniref:Fluoride-specific ion channel FluC n=1 Tax=Lacisediminihabitans changchengi TaxID=2787634 RepID=A0A934W5I2_9MICO|nr:CrcB family protein [Lacisediminihabitans changchengi]MBK4348540.1 CrcB family protein [Lacisediminihabitans changchengi]